MSGLLFQESELSIVSGTEKTAISFMTGFNGPGGQARVIDLTHSKSPAKEYAMGLKDNGQLTADLNFDPQDPGQAQLEALRNSRTTAQFELLFSGPTTASKTFAAYVLGLPISGATDDKISASLTLQITGDIVDA